METLITLGAIATISYTIYILKVYNPPLIMKQLNTLKRYYVNVKFEKYGTYTIEARSKEHALEIYNDGNYGWDDYSEDFGEFNEVVEDVEEEVFADTQLTLSGVLV